MSSLRLEVEQAMGLKFPERSGEAMVRFEESMEVPRSAEKLMRGLYRDPERVRRSFQNLHQETVSLLDILLPRRSRLREWSEDLPERPKEAETFLKETTEQLVQKEQRMSQLERDLMNELLESGFEDLFPIPNTAFAQYNLREPSVKIFLRPLGRLAEIMRLNPEQLRQAVRVYYLFMLLLISGKDLDSRTFSRTGEEPALHLIVSIYALKYLKAQSNELSLCLQEWIKTWGGKIPPQSMLQEHGIEKMRAAMVFWRRQTDISWDECWRLVNHLGRERGNENSEGIFELNPVL